MLTSISKLGLGASSSSTESMVGANLSRSAPPVFNEIPNASKGSPKLIKFLNEVEVRESMNIMPNVRITSYTLS